MVLAESKEEVGMILISPNTWKSIKDKFPPAIEGLFPTMGFMNDIPIKVSDLVPDDKIIPVPKKVTDSLKNFKFQTPDFKVFTEHFFKCH